VHYFLASKATDKIPGVPAKSNIKINTIAVMCGGTMGAGICIVFLVKGYRVILKEINEKALLAGVERILQNLYRVLKARKLPPIAAEQIMRNLATTTTYEGFETADLVIEAALENIQLKQQIFAELEKVCKPSCILASNTSTIDLEVIGKNTKAQDRVIGLHYFSPAHIMPLLEIIRTKQTSPQVIAASVLLSKNTNKIPVVVGNCVGFTANRVFFPYGQGASLLVDSGIDPYRIDRALESFGMPMGVFKMADLSGVDIFVHVGEIMRAAYGDRCYISTIGKRLFDAKRLGQKSGSGYYKYAGPKALPDPQGLNSILAGSRTDAALPQLKDSAVSDEQIIEMLLFPVINEGFRIIEEGHVVRESDIDICSVTGYGFPAWRGGIMFYGRIVGLKHVHARLQHFSQSFGAKAPAAKSFFAPSPLLTKLASQN